MSYKIGIPIDRLSEEAAVDLWHALHLKTRNPGNAKDALEPMERRLYDLLTERFCIEAVTAKIDESP